MAAGAELDADAFYDEHIKREELLGKLADGQHAIAEIREIIHRENGHHASKLTDALDRIRTELRGMRPEIDALLAKVQRGGSGPAPVARDAGRRRSGDTMDMLDNIVAKACDPIVAKRSYGTIHPTTDAGLIAELLAACKAIIDARDSAALSDDPAYYDIDQQIDAARSLVAKVEKERPDAVMPWMRKQERGAASSATVAKRRTVKKRSRGTCVFQSTHPKVKDKKDHFPINDLAHARNALARVEQYDSVPSWYDGTLGGLQGAVKREVYEKFPGLKSRKEEREGK